MKAPQDQHADPLEVIGIVDLHWSGHGPPRLPDFEGIDLVVLAGDLTNFGGADRAARLIGSIEEAGPRVLAVCGNVDRTEIESYLEERRMALDRTARCVEGVCFVGISAGLPFGGCPYERTEDEFRAAAAEAFAAAAALDDEARGPTLLVSHQPPVDTACDLAHGRHVGSRAIREAIATHQPDLVFCGHIHEGIGVDRIGRSRIVNPGPAFDGHFLRLRVSDRDIEILEPGSGGRR